MVIMPRATILLLMSLGAIGIHGFRREVIIDQGAYLEVCRQAPIELGIVLDSSESISREDFRKAIEFLQHFISQYDFSSSDHGIRVSIITYGNGTYPEDGFNLTTYHTKDEVVNAIGNIPHREGALTSTEMAIDYMHKVQFSPTVVRPKAEKIAIVITDGKSQKFGYTKEAAEEARADGINMFAVGVGPEVWDVELLNIAGDQSQVVMVDNYDKLDSIKEALAKQTCVIKMKPTTTPVPRAVCGEVNPSDIYFVFSPVDLGIGIDASAWTTSFISNTLRDEDMAVGFRYGAISGSCPGDEGFDLNDYNNVPDMIERLTQYDRSRTSGLVQKLISEGYTAEKGARQGVSKVAVIFVNSGTKQGADLSSYLDQLVSGGVRVFIADPFGTGVQVQGATSLDGLSSLEQSESFISQLCPELRSDNITTNPC